MATPIHGRKGRLYVGIASDSAEASPVANLTSWSLGFEVPTIDGTTFGDTNEVAVAGLPRVTGSYNGYYDTASPQLYTAATDGLARKFYLYPTNASTSTYWFGTALFDFSVTGAVTGGIDISGSLTAASSVSKVTS